jgi:GT2 family glycosyltransferase
MTAKIGVIIDTDLNFRAQLAGWKVMYVPTALVYHKVRATIGHMSDMAVYYTLRNIEFVRIKNIPLPLFIRCFLEFSLGTISELMYFAFKHGKMRLYLKAKMDVMRMLRIMFGKRRRTRKKSCGPIKCKVVIGCAITDNTNHMPKMRP